MSFPSPSEKQARILWFSFTTLAIVLVLAVVGLLLLGLGWVIQQLTSVLLPLAVAAILACLLDPLVDFFETKLRIPRARSIVLVFFLAVMLVLILLATVVPKLVYETNQLVVDLPNTAKGLTQRVDVVLHSNPAGQKIQELWDQKLAEQFQQWLSKALPAVGTWLLAQCSRVAGWMGLLLGLALVPIYVFYFLREKEGIRRQWTDYLPIWESKAKQELVFVLGSFNDCLVAFFRGQILVSLCSGTMLTVGYLALGLNYSILLGVVAALLGIVPYLGSMISVSCAVALAAVQFHDWVHPLLVVGLFVLVQMAEGLYVSPKIIGERVGLHPVTVIISVMVGTTLLGGVLGGMLAIPVTAALRALMFRYIWTERQKNAV